MKSINWIFLSVFIVLLSFTACDSDDDNNHSGEPPVIEIISPADNSVFDHGDTISIEVVIEHHTELHNHLVELIDLNHDEVVWEEKGHSHEHELHIHGYFVNEVHHHTDFELKATANDHHGRETTESVSFHCHPDH